LRAGSHQEELRLHPGLYARNEDVMSESKKYEGGCHCGKVRYEVNVALERVVACNCSICGKTGALLAFVPAAEFKLVSGEGALTDYQFGKKRVHHKFCSACGIRSFGHGAGPDGSEMFAINVRCLDGVDADALPADRFDGKSL
jgi:hypothetical protein